ncbi:MAG: hypothetical protein ABIP75_17240 [Pyrinomonadaceae bacterium]
MWRRRREPSGYAGILRLFLLALILALVLWWSVAVTGPRHVSSRPQPRQPEKRPARGRVQLNVNTRTATATEVILLDEEEMTLTELEPVDDYWPDIIDA